MIFKLAILSIFAVTFSKCAISRIRGVSLSMAPLYDAKEHFTCLDGSKTIKFLQLNDEFCDCPDSSDEPGTSACPGGIFHCPNLNHRPKDIVSSRVNDGICDCCDGSDEYDSSVKCENTCLEQGREEREKTKARQELLKKGGLIKQEMVTRGKALKVERDTKLLELEKRQSEAQAIKDEKEKIKNEIEKHEQDALSVYREMEEQEKIREEEISIKEAENAFSSYDSNGDGFVDIPEIQSQLAFDKDRDGVVSEEEAFYFLDNKERADLETFKSAPWSNIKSQLLINDGVFTPPEETHEEEEAELEQDEQEEHEEEEGEETGTGEVEEQHSETYKEPIKYDPKTQELIDQANQARNEHSEADRVIRDIEREIKDLKDIHSRDYGPNEEFASLAGECFNYEDREYIYKLCPFDRASQQPKNGGGETRLGSWDKWTGPSKNKYGRMMYDGGATCWNGPQRSADVLVECGLENKLTAVSEPNRCEYSFTFQTPAACVQHGEHHEHHDEL